MDSKILLNSGTNELEVLQFKLNDNYYGINVAKVKEIIRYSEVTPVPNAHPSIEGLIMPRDTMITVIDLKNALGIGESKPGGLFIITNFNNLAIAFHVDAVNGINRYSWHDILPPNQVINNEELGVATGIIKTDKGIMIVLDFEKIVAEISPDTGINIDKIEHVEQRDKKDISILIAEDSHLLNQLISEALKKAGYTKQTRTNNGLEAWEFLNKCLTEGTLDEKVNLVITDIEMPQMDGHRLTKLIKNNDQLKHIPVVIFSSLVNEEMKIKGKQVGADAQFSKPEINDLIEGLKDIV